MRFTHRTPVRLIAENKRQTTIAVVESDGMKFGRKHRRRGVYVRARVIV